MTKILGLDLGTNSIGWAVVETENNISFELKEKGVRIFQEGVKIEKGIEGSKAADRTEHRSARRIKFRRKLRKYETLKVLIENDMCPLLMEELSKWRNFKDPETGKNSTFKIYPTNSAFLSWQQTKDEKDGTKIRNPYYYRSLAANQKLDWSKQEERYKIGRAFYHMTQRRGFLSNRLDTSNDDVVEMIRQSLLNRLKDIYPTASALHNSLLSAFSEDEEDKNVIRLRKKIDSICKTKSEASEVKEEINNFLNLKENKGKVRQAIDELSEKIEKANCKTLGEYFYKLYLQSEKIRNQYTHREEHYLHEFEVICDKQQLPPILISSLKEAIFYQRPLKSQKGLVGKCPFETNKPRCAVSHPAFEEYRMLCFVNNMKIQTPDDEKMRQLAVEEREKIIQRFYLKRDHFDFEDLAKQLAPKKRYKYFRAGNKNPEDFLFNYSMKTTVSACPVSARFLSVFGKNWTELKIDYKKNNNKTSFIDIYDVWHVLFTFDSDEKLMEFAKNRLQLNDDQTKEFLSIKLKQDYASLSLKAINKILPYLQEGLIYSHAVFLAKMEDVIPKDIWDDDENKKIIREEIHHIIKTQNEEKQVLEIVNGMIKICRENNWTWSKEGEQEYQGDLRGRLKSYYGQNRWESFGEEKQKRIEENAFKLFKTHLQKNMGKGEFAKMQRIDERVKVFITDHFDVNEDDLQKLYHPSALDVYSPPIKGKDGKEYLGSPMVSSVRNPMAMRALHQLRKLINELIKQDVIDATTKVNIEMARDLKNANERKALQSWQRDRENKRKEYAERIKEYFTKEGKNVEPSETDILKYQLWVEQITPTQLKESIQAKLKYQLWEEQKHICLYTGKNIGLSDFLGADPKYDIEHTIPRSLSLDNSQENKTLCDNRFNRDIKRNKIPYELENHDEIIERIGQWKEDFDKIEKQIEIQVRISKGATTKEAKDNAIQRRHKLTFERNYWKNKYNRFTMEDVPEGFKNSQLVDTGIITKYSRLYLNTLFNRVYTVKGNTVADFRRIWGLQDEYNKKARVNHIHHCIDAITIACISKKNYESLAKYYHESEDNMVQGIGNKPRVDKPWDAFVQDLKEIEKEVFISHHTPDVLPKQSKKKSRKRGRIQYNKHGETIYLQGDTTRGSLHQETFYGAIELNVVNKKGDEEKVIKYVVRKPLDKLEDSDLKKIVDDKVREIIIEGRKVKKLLKKEIEALQKKLRNAEEDEEIEIKKQIEEIKEKLQNTYSLPNKNGGKVPIKKVRIYTHITNPILLKPHRDKAKINPKPYKENLHVANDGNYLMAIYEGKDSKGKIKRDFEVVSNLEAGEYFKLSVQNDLKPQGIKNIDGLVPDYKEKGGLQLPLKGVLKVGTMVILWENSPEEIWEEQEKEITKRLYKIIGLSNQRIKSPNGKINEYATIMMRFHQEAKPSTELKVLDGAFSINEEYKAQRKMNHNQFNALIEGLDFKLNALGQIDKI